MYFFLLNFLLTRLKIFMHARNFDDNAPGIITHIKIRKKRKKKITFDNERHDITPYSTCVSVAYTHSKISKIKKFNNNNDDKKEKKLYTW